MTLTHGADVDRLRTVSTQLSTSACGLAAVDQTGASLAATTRDAWAGEDMTTFMSSWQTSRQQLLACADRLSLFAQQALEQAEEQDTASGDSSADRGSTTDQGSAALAPPGSKAAAEDRRVPRKSRHSFPLPYSYFNNHDDPGPGNVEFPDGVDPDDKEIKEMLATPDGRAALDWLARNDVSVSYKDDHEGAFYRPFTNSIVLGEGQYRDGRSLIHEANHARWDAESRAANPDRTTRSEYINSEFDEETDCQTQTVYYAKQQREAGDFAQYTRGEAAYDTGYSRAYNEALEAGRPEHLARLAGDTGGRNEIRDLYTAGEYKSSGSGGKSYGEKAGEWWDSENDWNPLNGV